MAISSGVPSLGSLAAKVVLENPEKAISSYKHSKLATYPETVSETTKHDVERVQTTLKKLNLPENIYIYTSGSDGRHEKANQQESPIELLIVCDKETKPGVAEKIDGFVKKKAIKIYEHIEWKDPIQDRLIAYSVKGTIYPSRFIHGLPLVGTEKQQNKFTMQFVTEVQGMRAKERQTFKERQVKFHTKQMDAVISGDDTRDVNLQTGELSYSGMGRKATKYPLLRPIQYTLDLVLVDAIRTKKLKVEGYAELLSNMPRTVPEQIQYMFEKGLLSKLDKQDVKDLQNAYILGLFYFQIGQHVISTDTDAKPVTFVVPDKEELQKAFKDTQRILKKM